MTSDEKTKELQRLIDEFVKKYETAIETIAQTKTGYESINIGDGGGTINVDTLSNCLGFIKSGSLGAHSSQDYSPAKMFGYYNPKGRDFPQRIGFDFPHITFKIDRKGLPCSHHESQCGIIYRLYKLRDALERRAQYPLSLDEGELKKLTDAIEALKFLEDEWSDKKREKNVDPLLKALVKCAVEEEFEVIRKDKGKKSFTDHAKKGSEKPVRSGGK